MHYKDQLKKIQLEIEYSKEKNGLMFDLIKRIATELIWDENGKRVISEPMYKRIIRTIDTINLRE